MIQFFLQEGLGIGTYLLGGLTLAGTLVGYFMQQHSKVSVLRDEVKNLKENYREILEELKSMNQTMSENFTDIKVELERKKNRD